MKETIRNYFDKLKPYPDYYKGEDFNNISTEIKSEFQNGIIPVERKEKTDVSLFEKEFGYKLPEEIADYINSFWHPYISGYVHIPECVVLFSVLKKEGDSQDDILFYTNNLITMAKNWREIGDVQNYIPIGWLGYSGSYVLYEVKTCRIFIEDMDSDISGNLENLPIANSLKELIDNMNIYPISK